VSKTTYVANDLADELDALAVVGRTLSGLDRAARDRVLRWAVERFDVSDPGTGTGAIARQCEDPALSVDGVELFDRKSAAERVDEALTIPGPSTTPPGVESMVRGFVMDFQRLVIEWQGV
jgi:hypothetical protein